MTIQNGPYPIRLAAKVARLKSPAMVDYLERQEIFKSELNRSKHRGKRRLYTFRDIFVLRTISALLDNGASVLALKKALQEFQCARFRAERALLEMVGGDKFRYLVVSNGKVYLCADRNHLVESSGQLAFAFMIDVETIHDEIRNSDEIMKWVSRAASAAHAA
ncbi:MAG: MerR family transcriptional regulator [Alphaproteobacteria bacterium]|nr:MerR family transcriptional regulator [Alphaproteobacteria bacterium]